jgi:hypothetical protein
MNACIFGNLAAKDQNWATLNAVREIAAANGATPQSNCLQLGREPPRRHGTDRGREDPRPAQAEPYRW